jgi:hypothetical protein
MENLQGQRLEVFIAPGRRIDALVKHSGSSGHFFVRDNGAGFF